MNLADAASTDWTDPVHFVRPMPPSELSPAMSGLLLGRVAVAIEDAWSVPPIVSFTTGLGVASAATCGRYTVAKDTFTSFPLALYLAPLLNPGGMKSPVLSALSAPLRDAQKMTAQKADPEIADRMRHQQALAGALQAIERKMAAALANGTSIDDLRASAEVLQKELDGRDPGDFHGAFRPISFGSDATPEALVKRAASQGGRIAVLSAEGGLLENLAGRYSDTGSAKVEFLDAAFDGEPYEGSRVSDPGRDIAVPWASLLLVVQPDLANTMLNSAAMRTRGFLQRFWLFLPPNANYTVRTTMPALERRTMTVWNDAVVGIWGDDGLWPDWRRDVEVYMPRECRDLILRFEQEHIAPAFGRAADEGNALMQGWLGKVAMTTWRVAALLAQLEEPGTDRVGIEEARAAIDYAQLALAHADYLFAHGPSASTRSPRYRVLATLLRGSGGSEDVDPDVDADGPGGSGGIEDAHPGEFTKNWLFQTMKSQRWVTGADVIESVLQDLAGLGWVRFVAARTTEVGGRPREVWALHPEAKTRFAAMTGTKP